MTLINYDFAGDLSAGDVQRGPEKSNSMSPTVGNFNPFSLKVFTYKLCSRSCKRGFTLDFILYVWPRLEFWPCLRSSPDPGCRDRFCQMGIPWHRIPNSSSVPSLALASRFRSGNSQHVSFSSRVKRRIDPLHTPSIRG